jgi:CheY-like chemotaxis protein
MNINQVILIDDDEVVNFFDKIVLSKLGFKDHEILVHLNSKSALEHLKKTQDQFDSNLKGAILLDMNMPVQDGWDFLAQYEKLNPDFINHYQLIILTSDKDSINNDKNKFQHLIQQFVYKPLTLNKFEDLMKKANAVFA